VKVANIEDERTDDGSDLVRERERREMTTKENKQVNGMRKGLILNLNHSSQD
jgi:hypothetical protein